MKKIPTPLESIRLEFESKMNKECAATIAAYDSLLNQCLRLANAMRHNDDYIIGKVMPKTASDRTNTERISEWFEKSKDNALDYILEQEDKREQDREREKLLSSLNLTSEQKILLGL